MAKKSVYTFKNYLGYDGKKFDEEKALAVLDEIGVNATNDLGETPLIVAAYLNRINILKKIIGEVDDVDYKVAGTFTESALLEACAQRRLDSIKLLVDAGARLEQVDRFELTPLAKIFTNTFSDPLPCATYLISKGAKITNRVMELGMSWNQEKFTTFLNMEAPVSAHVNPLQEALIDGFLDISHVHNIVNNKDYNKTAKVIWEQLVPKNGQANTIQGELLRAIEKLRYESHRNGNINFSKNCHVLLIKFLKQHLVDEQVFDEEVTRKLLEDLNKISKGSSPYLEHDVYDRIIEGIIEWYLKHPKQILHTQNDKLYC